jgi:hypothetical protein
LLTVLYIGEVNALIIDRAIVSSDTNPDYLDFWPIVAKAWIKLGIKPTLALIADNLVQVDESLGDVIRFRPIPGVSNALYSQAVRLLLPIIFKDEVCLISDIDMIPISESYFKDSVRSIADDKFVVYRDAAYSSKDQRYPMCYNVAKGTTFQEVFGIKKIDEIPAVIKKWAEKKMGWATDEILLYAYLNHWNDFNSRCVRLRHTVARRIDRSNWSYDLALLKVDYYIDCHSVRPYKRYKKEVDMLTQLLGIN